MIFSYLWFLRCGLPALGDNLLLRQLHHMMATCVVQTVLIRAAGGVDQSFH